MWKSKNQKNKLLTLFVSRCYNRDQDQNTNRLKLEALVRFRQCSREWKRNMQGFSWLTESEMKEKKWSDAKVEGAKQHCLNKKFTKECPYEKVKKYLVLVSDDVQKLWWQVKTNYFIAELFAPFKFQIKLITSYFRQFFNFAPNNFHPKERRWKNERAGGNDGECRTTLVHKESYSTQYIYIYTIYVYSCCISF